MALDMTAAVKIKASVDGIAQIDALQRSLGNADKQATGLQGAFGRMRGALGALLPAAGVAGLVALGKQSVDAADNLNDLSQRTGVAVESLSRFGNAARDSGSNVDEVAKAMGKLARSVVDPSSRANEALKSIGINATDASGKIRSMDQIMLDVAGKFSGISDPAKKAQLAFDLFGKAGTNLIPMLNQGREALEQYSATITTEGAQAADQFNDSLNAVGNAVAGPFNQAITALLPVITSLAQGIAGALQAFSALPGPVQAIIAGFAALVVGILALAPAISAVITVWGALSAALAGGAIFAKIAGTLGAVVPAITAVGGALAGLAPVLIGIFTGPVGWITLLVAAGVAIFAFRDKIGAAFQAIGQVLRAAAQGFMTNFVNPVKQFMAGLFQNIVQVFGRLGQALSAPFQAAVGVVRNVVNSMIGGIERAVNGAISALNRLIQGANAALSRLNLPSIPTIPMVSLPRFAEGGMVNRPTMAMVGEGGEPEYIVPQSKATQFANNWLSGVRGPAAIPRFAEGGMVNAPAINIQTGPVMQQDGKNYVTMQDLEKAMQTVASSVLNNSRTNAGRRFVGVGA